jgi:hypothetical protein
MGPSASVHISVATLNLPIPLDDIGKPTINPLCSSNWRVLCVGVVTDGGRGSGSRRVLKQLPSGENAAVSGVGVMPLIWITAVPTDQRIQYARRSQ